MSPLWILLIIVLVVLLVGGLPTWGYWGPLGGPMGYGPSGALAVVILVIVLLLLLGRI